MAYLKIYGSDVVTGTYADTAVDLLSYAQIDNVRRPRAAVDSRFAGDGSSTVHLVSKLTRPVITMDAWVYGSASERRAKIAALMGKVSFLEPRALRFEDDGDWFYTVVPQGARDVDDYIDSSCVHLSFESVYPWQWGISFDVTQAVAEAGIEVPGNMPAVMQMPKTSNTQWAVTTNASGEWGFTVNNRGTNPGCYFRFNGLSASTQYIPEIDTLRQIARFSLTDWAPIAIVNTDMIWPVFYDGAKVSMFGSMTKMMIRPRRV